MKRDNRLTFWSLGAVVSLVIASITGACGGQAPLGVSPTAPPTLNLHQSDEETEPPVVPGGSWTGTITLHAVINTDETKDISSGDPGSTYYEAGTSHDTTQTDTTDTFNIVANDPDDVTYGIGEVDFQGGGSATTTGTTLERYIQNWDKQNSGCTWKEEDGTQVSGSWNDTGRPDGSLRLGEDGAYHMELSASVGDPTTGEYETPKLPHRIWETLTDISAGCEANSGYDTTDTQGPIIWWASSLLGGLDVNNKYAYIDGQIAGTPGNTIDGSISWTLVLPAAKLDITWHLVHSGPIVLPHS